MSDAPKAPPVRVMIAADPAYLRHAPTTLASVRAATSGDIEVGVVVSGLSQHEEAIFRAACPGLDIRFLDISYIQLGDMATRFYLSPFAYARIFMPDLVHWERFIYLDIDMIVRRDLRELYETDLDGAPLGAVTAEGGLNSGMLVVDAAQWRAQGAIERMMNYARTHQPYNADQDTIEAVFAERIHEIDHCWNFCVTPLWVDQSRFDVETLEQTAIIHFITGFKPWNLGRLFIAKPFLAEWEKHRVTARLPVVWKHEVKLLGWQVGALVKYGVKRS